MRYDFGVLRVEVFAFSVAGFHVVELARGIIWGIVGIIIAAGALMEEQFPFALTDGKFAFGRMVYGGFADGCRVLAREDG